MRNNPIDLRDPRLVMVVAVLLVAVAAINLGPFLSHGGGAADPAMTETLVLPSDAAALSQAASRHVTGTASLGPSPGMVWGATDLTAGRDPFQKGTGTPAPTQAPSQRQTRAGSPAVPTCNAVMLGGREPTALIGNHAYHCGDSVAGYRVHAISRDGVTLHRSNKSLFLPVGQPASAAAVFPLVTRPKQPGAEGRTELERPDAAKRP